MAQRQAVIGDHSGRADASIMLIGEAPGRLGADRTQRPFVGDRSGENLHRLLEQAGIDRTDVFITNAVLCYPTDGRRNNRPTAKEVANCGEFLAATISLVCPRVIGTLGAVALDAVQRRFAADRARWRLAEVVGKRLALDGFIVIPLYHPSPRVMNGRRDFEAQLADMRSVAHAAQVRRG
jgi:uracil-DNA glycosylase family 4